MAWCLVDRVSRSQTVAEMKTKRRCMALTFVLHGHFLYKAPQLTLNLKFDPECFQFVLTFFRNASDNFYGTSTTPGLFAAQQQLFESPSSEFGPATSQNPLLSKQAIIVLREELEYFSIPPKDGNAATDLNGIANDSMVDIKRRSGDYLIEKRSIFTALQRNVNKENNVAEQHLIDMLCMR